jgi:CheY-like chemotaxis protein
VPHFVIVEDDHLQRGPLEDRLSSVFEDATVDTLCSEGEFREALPRMRDRVPDLVVMDVMVRWDVARHDLPQPPPDVQEEGYYRAGLRAAWLMHDDPALCRVPLVLYTILELGDVQRDGRVLPPNASYVGKDCDLDVLVRHIRSRLRTSAQPRR